MPDMELGEYLAAGRVELTALTVQDADEMTEVLGAAELYRFIGGAPLDRPQLRARYELLTAGQSGDGTEGWHNWIVRTRADGRAVGTIQATVSRQRRSADMAWVIGVPWQRMGYAAEAARAAFEWLIGREDVDTVTAHVHPDHLASEQVARRIGLEPTDYFHDGERRWSWTASPRQDPPYGRCVRVTYPGT